MPSDLTILLAGGGSGGHLYPGVAVADALRHLLPDARPLFLATRREIDATILGPAGYDWLAQPITPPRRSVGGLLRFWRKWRQTVEQVKGVFDERNPAAVLGLGGYAAGVAVKLAAERGLPTLILNPDVIPGKANLYLMPRVSRVCAGFAETADHVPSPFRDKLAVTGCPIRPDVVRLPPREGAVERLDLDPLLRTLVVTGASQGATTINQAMPDVLRSVKGQGWQVLHLSGPEQADAVRAGYREASAANGKAGAAKAGVKGEAPPVRVIDFTPEMADVWAVADLAVSRAGASSVSELAACGVPSILVPYPYHRDQHQRANAAVLERAGGATVVDDARDRKSNAAALTAALEPLLYDAARRKAMGDAARSVARPDAAGAVAREVAALLDRPAGNGR